MYGGRTNRPSSINFDKEGGICTFLCCNFDPAASYYTPLTSYFFLSSNNVLMYGEEPGPGFLRCACITIWYPCTAACMLCEPIPVTPTYICCGLCGPVNYNGLTFFVVDGAVQCRINVKHCCTEDSPVTLFDVQDIIQTESRHKDVVIPGGKGTSGFRGRFVYYTFDILYRNEMDQLMRYKTREMMTACEDQEFLDAVRQYIGRCRSKATSLVTFAMLGQEPEVLNVPLDVSDVTHKHPYASPAPQQAIVRGDTAVHPELVVPVCATAVTVVAQPDYDMY